jgi:hypothetical protein
MEIHAPEEPIFTWKQLLIHIGIVTLGILIALSLEGLLEWNHHQHMIQEARENIRSEIEDNAREMTGHLAGSEQNRSQAVNVLKWIADIQKSHKSAIKSLQIGFNRADLANTSWTTAQAVGALALMDYSEVKRAAAIYELQDEFQVLQRRAEDSAIGAMTLFTARKDDPDKASSAELTEEKRLVANSISTLMAQAQMGTELQKRYREWLKHK